MGIVTRMRENRASPENPSTSLANPAAWIVDLFNGGTTQAGVRVNNSNALTIAPVYAAIRVITDTFASLPLVTYERRPGARRMNRVRATGHHLYPLLKERANPFMSAFTFRETMAGHLESWGNAFAEIERDGAGRVLHLWPLRPDRMKVTWTGTRKVYLYSMPDGREVPFRPDEIFHVPGFGFDGLVGYNPIALARESLGLTKATEVFGASFFGNGSRVSGVLSSPNNLSDAAYKRLRQSWEEQHRGAGNHHRVAILEEGTQWQQIGIPPEDAQFLATRQFQVADVARWFRVPPHMIGDLSRSTNNNIEHQSLEFVVHTVGPRLERWEQPMNWELVPEEERGTVYAEFNVDGLLRGDIAARTEHYRSMWGIGVYSINDIREKENLNSVEGGDTHFVPLNMVALSTQGDPFLTGGDRPSGPDSRGELPSDLARLVTRNERALPPGTESAVAPTDAQRRSAALRRRQMLAHRPVFEQRAEFVLSSELKAVRKALARSLSTRDAIDLNDWLDEFYDTFNETVADRMRAAVQALAGVIYASAAEEVEGDQDVDAQTEQLIEDFADTLGVRWAASSRRQLQEILRDTEPEDLEAALTQRLDEWEETRAGKVGLHETVRLAGAVAVWAYAANERYRITWVAFGDNCPYCDQLDGKTIDTRSEVFVEGGSEIDPDDGEHDPLPVRYDVGHAPAHGGCDCSLAAA